MGHNASLSFLRRSLLIACLQTDHVEASHRLDTIVTITCFLHGAQTSLCLEGESLVKKIQDSIWKMAESLPSHVQQNFVLKEVT